MENKDQNCIICNTAACETLYKIEPYSLIKCLSCGLVRVLPLPNEQERKRINQSIYSDPEYRQRYFRDERFFRRWFRNKIKIIEKFKPQKGKILDIGCSYGFFLDEAQKKGWDIYGIEINPVTGTYARDKFGDRIFVGEIAGSPFAAFSFDAITLWDVVEHTVDPVKFLNNIKSYLKPAGIICIQSPNIESYISKLKGKNWDWLTLGDHLYFFSLETLRKTLELAGLKSIYLDTWEPRGYFIDSLMGFNEINNFCFELYRRTIVRIFRKVIFFIFIPFQRTIKKKGEGALIVSFAVSRI